jgi:hypothetical protein
MTDLTLTMEEEMARWIRAEAARRGLSISRFVGEILRQQMPRRMSYGEAKQQFLSLPTFRSAGSCYPKREDLYDRPRLRR